MEFNEINNVTLVKKFVSDTGEDRMMYAAGNLGVANSSGLLAGEKHSWVVRSARIDGVVSEALKRGPVVMKMDIEGSEYATLPTLTRLFRHQNFRALYLSMHPFAILRSVPGRSMAIRLSRRWSLLRKTLAILPALNAFAHVRDGEEGHEISAKYLALQSVFSRGIGASEREIYLTK